MKQLFFSRLNIYSTFLFIIALSIVQPFIFPSSFLAQNFNYFINVIIFSFQIDLLHEFRIYNSLIKTDEKFFKRDFLFFFSYRFKLGKIRKANLKYLNNDLIFPINVRLG